MSAHFYVYDIHCQTVLQKAVPIHTSTNVQETSQFSEVSQILVLSFLFTFVHLVIEKLYHICILLTTCEVEHLFLCQSSSLHNCVSTLQYQCLIS